MTTPDSPAKIKVLHLITRLERGGAQQNTLYTVSHLDPKRFEAVLACGEGENIHEKGKLYDEAYALTAQQPPVHLRLISDLVRDITPFSPLRDLAALLQTYSLLVEEQPKIVHTHSAKAGILGRFAAWLAGVPVIIHTFHGFGFARDDVPRGFYIFLEKLAARISNRLIFVSNANQETASTVGIGNSSTYRVIRSGIKLENFPARIESKEKIKKEIGARMHQPLIVTVGNYKRQKRPLHFLEVALRVRKAFPEVNYAFVGNGTGHFNFGKRVEARRISLGLTRELHLLGWRKDVPEILAAADIFVLTSLWEGLPRALVEAMKSGLPCVCYGVDGVTDILKDGENGFSIRPGDIEGMAEKICRLLKDEKLRERLGRAAAASIGPEFDIDHMVRQQEALYEELLAAAAPKTAARA